MMSYNNIVMHIRAVYIVFTRFVVLLYTPIMCIVLYEVIDFI